jgi:ABC-2 type transport system permease protein
MSMAHNFKELRRKRGSRFLAEMLPYLRYAVNSLPAFLFIALTCLYVYGQFVKQLPDQFPALWVTALLLTPAAASSPVRTFLREADTAFLLPREAELGPYFRAGWLAALIGQCIMTAAAWLLLWPLVRAGSAQLAESGAFASVPAQLLLLKAVNLWCGWRVKQFGEPLHRRVYTAIRWLLTFALIAVNLHYSWPLSLLAVGIVYLAFVPLHLMPRQHVVHWEHLIRLERHHRARWMLVIGGFVDVPREAPIVSRNEPLGRMGGWFAFDRRSAYKYLYTLTWARSELAGICIRLTLAGAFFIAIIPGAHLKAALMALFAFLLGVQLAALEKAHRHHDLSFVYPLPKEARAASALLITYRLHAAAVIVLLAAALRGNSYSLLFAAGAAAVIAALYVYYCRYLTRRRRS